MAANKDSYVWTPEKLAYLRAARERGDAMADIARALGTTKGSLNHAVMQHGLPLIRNSTKAPTVAVPKWTDKKKSILQEYHGHRSAADIGHMIGMTKDAVISQARRMGLAEPKKPQQRVTGFAGSPVKHCQFPMWPHDERPTGKYCGKAVRDTDTPYCAAHAERCYRTRREGPAFVPNYDMRWQA